MIFTILGEPKAKGRPRFKNMGKYMGTYTPKDTINYENLVKLSYQNECIGMINKDTMIIADIKAYFTIPSSTSKKKRCDMIQEFVRPIKKPDLDNIAKIILDSLNGIAYYDDSQIVKLTVEKYYSENPRVEVELLEYVYLPF